MFFSTIVLQMFLASKWYHVPKATHEEIDGDEIDMLPHVNKPSVPPHFEQVADV
jgi:hypothetical protein